eukprot:14935589-Ditylum_brightwellii.AAC.1
MLIEKAATEKAVCGIDEALAPALNTRKNTENKLASPFTTCQYLATAVNVTLVHCLTLLGPSLVGCAHNSCSCLRLSRGCLVNPSFQRHSSRPAQIV